MDPAADASHVAPWPHIFERTGPKRSSALYRRFVKEPALEQDTMTHQIRFYLGLETLIFVTAALIHFEVLFDGYPDPGAGIAESVIAAVLLLGLLMSLARPPWTRATGLAAQIFALLGTFVGLTLLFVVGPRTTLDIVIHLVMVLVLIVGLVVTARSRPV